MNGKISGVIVRHVSDYRERAALQPAAPPCRIICHVASNNSETAFIRPAPPPPPLPLNQQ